MELFKGLTQEELKELRSIIIDIGLIKHYGIKDWRFYIQLCVFYAGSVNNNFNIALAMLQVKKDDEIELIIQGVLNE